MRLAAGIARSGHGLIQSCAERRKRGESVEGNGISRRREREKQRIRGAGEPGCRRATDPVAANMDRAPKSPLIGWTFQGKQFHWNDRDYPVVGRFPFAIRRMFKGCSRRGEWRRVKRSGKHPILKELISMLRDKRFKEVRTL